VKKFKNKNNLFSFIAYATFAVVVVLCCLFSLMSETKAQTSADLDVSAYLLNANNEAIPNGEYEVRFALYVTDRASIDPYPSETDFMIWEETQAITVYNGLLKAYLGEQTPLPASVNFATRQYYLGLRIGEDSEMVPRKRIASVPLARNAIGSFTANNALTLNGARAGTSAGNIVVLGSDGKIDSNFFSVEPTDTSNFVEDDDDRLHDQNTDTGTSERTFVLGDGAGLSGNFDLAISNTSGMPTLRYNSTTATWQLSNDGSNFSNINTGTSGNFLPLTGGSMTGNIIFAPTQTISSTIISGIMSPAQGGLGIDTSGLSGVPVVSAGTWAISSNLGLGNGGTGASLSDPNLDGIMVWDDSLGEVTWLATDSSLNIDATPTIGVNLSTSGSTSTVLSNSGLEIGANGLRLLGGCNSGQILVWNDTTSNWACSNNTGGTSDWTASGPITYLTDVNSNFALGGSSLTGSIFAIDESAGDFYFGYDNSANPTFLFEATDGDAGSLGFNTNDAFFFSGANVGIGDTTPNSLLTVGAGDAFQVNNLGQVVAGTWNGTDIDISDYTNLAGDSEIVLTDDTLSIAASIARDSELHSATTLVGSYDYATLAGQAITLGQVDLTTDVTGTLPIANGGTGLSSYTAGDMVYYTSGTALSRLAVGNNGDALTLVAGVPTWGPVAGSAHPLLSTAHSDTATGTVARGDLITGQTGTPTWDRLPLGSNGFFLKSDGTDIAWAQPTSSDVGLGSVENTALSTWIGSTNITTLGTITTGTWNGSTIDISDYTNLTGDSEIVLTGDVLSIAGSIARDSELHNAVTFNGTPDYLTLSGQQITLGQIDLTADVTGTLPVANGGTGAVTLATNGVLYGNGTGAVGVTTAGTDGQLLIANGSGVPTFVSMSGEVLITNAGVATIQANAIETGEIANDTILEEDLDGTNDPTAGYILSYDSGSGGFTWVANSGGSGASLFTDAGTFTHLTSTSDDLAFGGSTASAPFFLDVSEADLTLGTDGTSGALNLYSEVGATDYTLTFQPSASMTQDTTYTFPVNNGASDQILTTDGSGLLSWKTVTGIGGAGDITAIGDVSSGEAFTSAGTQGTSLYFYDANGRGELTIADLTAARTYTLPNQSGTLAMISDITGAVHDAVTVSDTSTIDLTLATQLISADVVADSIGDTQLAFNTGQHLTSTSTPTFAALTVNGNITTTGTVDGKDIATYAAMLNEAETITADWINTANPWDISTETNLLVGNGITLTDDTLTVTAAGGLLQTTGGLTTTGILEDLNTLGAAATDGQFIVATGAGTFAYESGATARASLGVDVAGTDNSTDVTIGTANGLSLSTQELSLGLASAGVTGALSGTDWSTFNNKQATISVGDGVTLTGTTLTVTAGGGLLQTTGGLTTTGILEDLNTLGAAATDGQFIVATGAGTFAYESGATARTSLGVDVAGTDNSTDVTVSDTSTIDLTLATQLISADVVADSIGDTQLAFNTGQPLTTLSTPTFGGVALTTDLAVVYGGTGASSLNNLITLATHTTGDYTSSITGGLGIDSTGATSGENISHTLSVDTTEIGTTTWFDGTAATDIVWTFDGESNDGTFGYYEDEDAFGFTNSSVGIGTTTPNYLLDISAISGSGDILRLSYDSSDVLAITNAQTTFSNPVNFASVGDVSMAHDLIMTNTTAGNIVFNGPGYLKTDSPSDNLNLTLSAANSGMVVVDDNLYVSGNVGIGTITPTAALDVDGGVTVSGDIIGTRMTLGMGVASANHNLLSIDTETANTGTNFSVISQMRAEPTANNDSLYLPLVGLFEYNSTFDNSGHGVGALGYLRMLDAGGAATLAAGIGVEGKIEVETNQTITTAIGIESQLSTNEGTVGEFVGFHVMDTNGLTNQPNSKYSLKSDLTDGILYNSGNVGIGITSPTAYLNIKAGTATAGTAPIKLTSGTNLGTAETGAFEYDGAELYFTPVGTTRETIAYVSDVDAITHNAVTLTNSPPATYDYLTLSNQAITLAQIDLTTDITGVLSVTNGGTGTATQFTPGSLVFAGASGVYTQDNVSLFFDDSTNRLGIGTATPGAMLDVYGTSNEIRLSYDTANYSSLSAGSNGELTIVGTGATDSALVIGDGLEMDTLVQFDGSAQDFYFGLDDTDDILKIGTGSVVGTTPILSITAAGNVGIGDDSPSALFTVGTADALQINASGQITAGTWMGSAIGAGYGGTGIDTSAATGVPTIATGTWSVSSSLGVTTGGTGTTTEFTPGSIVFAGASGIYAQDNTNFFFDDTNDRLGIGTATPSYVLDVSGASGVSDLFRVASNGTDIVTVTDAQTTFNNPVNFTNVGDVSMAHDLVMTNSTAASVKFEGPGYVLTESAWQNLDLTLSAANTGSVVIDDTLQMVGDIIPDADDTYNLGSSTKRFKDSYLSGSLNLGTDGNAALVAYDTANNYLTIDPDGDATAEFIFADGGQMGIGTAASDALLNIMGTTEQMRLAYDASNYASFDVDSAGNLQLQASSGVTRLNTSAVQNYLQIYDSAGTDYIQLTHNGTNAQITTNTGAIEIGLSGDFVIDTGVILGIGVNVGIGGVTSFGTAANNVLAIASSTAPTTSVVDGIQLFAVEESGSHELRVRDEAGNITTLSPHNFSLIPEEVIRESLAWSYYSERGTTAINVDMTKAMRLLEQISGQKLIYKVDLLTGATIEDGPKQDTLVSIETKGNLDLEDLELKTIEEIANLGDLGTQVNENIAIVGSRLERLEEIIASLGNGNTGSLLESVLAQLTAQASLLESRLSSIEESLETFASRDELQELTIATGSLNEQAITLSTQVDSQLAMIDALSEKVASIDGVATSAPIEEVWHEFTLDDDSEISTDLGETQVGEGNFSGMYNGESDDREFVIQKAEGVDLSGFEVNEGELVFDVFMSDADSIEDFTTEFGNDGNGDARFEWLKDSHPFFATGWNEVRLPLAEMVSIEDIDWTASDFFRVYLRFSTEVRVELRNIRFEAPELRSLAQIEVQNDILDENLNLLLDADQSQAITVIANTVQDLQTQFETQSTNTELRLASTETALDDLNAFDDLVADQLSAHENRIANLEAAVGMDALVNSDKFTVNDKGDVVFEGTVSAEKIKSDVMVAGEYTVTNDNESGDSKNTGSTIIYEGEVEVFVENPKIRNTSRIIVTPIGNSPIDWIVSDKRAGEGFVIRLEKEAEFDVAFDYWIVQTE